MSEYFARQLSLRIFPSSFPDINCKTKTQSITNRCQFRIDDWLSNIHFLFVVLPCWVVYPCSKGTLLQNQCLPTTTSTQRPVFYFHDEIHRLKLYKSLYYVKDRIFYNRVFYSIWFKNHLYSNILAWGASEASSLKPPEPAFSFSKGSWECIFS